MTSPASIALEIAVAVAAGEPPPETVATEQVRLIAEEVGDLPPEVLRRGLQRVLMSDEVGAAFQWLHDSGILARVLPELEATVEFTQEVGRSHKDVWKHTKQVIAQSPRIPEVRWAALFHDIGKVPTRAFIGEGKVTFHGHAEVGARMFDRVARRLQITGDKRAEIRFLIQHHLRANQYDGTWTDSAVRRFDREMGEHLDHLLLLSRADITSARPHKVQRARAQLDELWQRIQEIREQDSLIPPLPTGLGNEIMQRFQLEPGRQIGDLKRALEQAIDEGKLPAHQESAVYLDYIEENLLNG